MIKLLRNSDSFHHKSSQAIVGTSLCSLRSGAIVFICFLFVGCQTTHPTNSREASTQETLDAVGSVTGVLIGKNLTEAEKRKMLRDLKKDKEAQSAMKSISGALEVQQTGIKYCPVDGKRFNVSVTDCPEHQVKLKELVD